MELQENLTQDQALEIVLSIRNLCDAAFLAASQGRNDLIYTLLEEMGTNAQWLMLDFCSHKNNPSITLNTDRQHDR